MSTRPARWPAHARRVVAAVALGVLTTVAVAWGITLRVRIHPYVSTPWGGSGRELLVSDGPVNPALGCRVISVGHVAAPGCDQYTSMGAFFTGLQLEPERPTGARASAYVPVWARETLWIPPDDGAGRDGLVRTVQCAGWPMRSMWAELDIPSTRRTGDAFNIRVPSWLNARASSPGDHVHLPVHPIPLGFAADTALFAAAWWTLLLLPAALRRAVRRRRGRCPACGYDRAGLAADAPCPECSAPGAPVTPADAGSAGR